MATQELLIRPGTRRTRVLRTGAGDFRRPPGRPRPVHAPGVATAAACDPQRMSGGVQLALVGLLTFLACLGLAAVNGLSSIGAVRRRIPYDTRKPDSTAASAVIRPSLLPLTKC